MNKEKKQLRAKGALMYLLYAVCGALCALPQIIGGLWILGWIAAVPVLFCEYTLQKEYKKPLLSAYRRGLAFFYPYGLVTFYWFIELYPLDFAGLTRPAALAVVLVAWLGLPLLQSVFSAFMLTALQALKKSSHPIVFFPFTAASLWVLFEWLQTQTWAGVPWGKLALGQTARLENIQSASLLGSYFISFLMILTASFIAVAAAEAMKGKGLKAPVCCLITTVVIFQANSIYGTLAVTHKNSSRDGDAVKVAAIQANISSDEKWSDKGEYTLDIYSELTMQAADEGAELIIWPETALPYELNMSKKLTEYLTELSGDAGAPILAGTFIRDTEKDLLYNAIVLSDPEDGISDSCYIKRRLVPFGEFVPWRGFFMTVIPPLAELSILSEDVTPGASAEVFETGLGKVGSLICFDSIFEGLALTSVREGAQLLAISTNDSWFHDSSAVWQHNSHAQLRSVETGRYTVRAANTGISSIITDTGEVTQLLSPLVEGVVTGEVHFNDYTTLYTLTGNLLVWLCAAFILFEGTYKAIKWIF